jgi:hypothetical protein
MSAYLNRVGRRRHSIRGRIAEESVQLEDVASLFVPQDGSIF